MKSLIFGLSTILMTCFAWANNPSYISTVCSPAAPLSKVFKVGLSELHQVKTVTVEYDNGVNNISIEAEVVTAEDIMNSHGKPVASKTILEKYDIKTLKTGTFFELEAHSTNTLDFAYTMFHYLNMDVVTAGPVPPGTYNATSDLILVSTFPENYSPQTGVLKLPLVCKTTVIY